MAKLLTAYLGWVLFAETASNLLRLITTYAETTNKLLTPSTMLTLLTIYLHWVLHANTDNLFTSSTTCWNNQQFTYTDIMLES